MGCKCCQAKKEDHKGGERSDIEASVRAIDEAHRNLEVPPELIIDSLPDVADEFGSSSHSVSVRSVQLEIPPAQPTNI